MKQKKAKRMSSSTSVVPIGNKICRPFVLEVMVFSPEAGYKFKVDVERSCTPEADALWKLVFDLYQVDNGEETQVVHVSYTSGTPVEQTAVQNIAGNGVTQSQADVLVNDVHPAAKAVVGVDDPTPEQKQAIHAAMQKVVSVDV
jgi:hypothetical protein